ncbi:putative crossover junction endodeoxyribonuclease RuvC [Ralstonia phage RP31]|uniref:Putative crossover junction endodeoxyribonuclease RuvC n=2 Tax=Ripduovirus RP12 TaxID=2560700 RepID=A0A1L7N0R4_9CAUD|nr:putative crossover junction endodeoxyribonuclease RuvC [Ralstonia phage RP12]BAW19060.1 putative crossover junction endodeoxyribonuclease RuvC [Ralstonia phage RP12]BAW19345.1 putative crossover junction endodeoxyribonuclease RuvC [Ralstonia phage RP31]
MFTNNCEPDDHIGRIVGIDPGSTTLGCTLLEYDVRTMEILRLCAYTFNADKMRLDDLTVLNHSERYARIIELSEALYNVFLNVRPNFIISESPFLKRRFPQAFAVLTEVVFGIRMAVRKYDPTMQLDLVDPPTAKKAVGIVGKEDMKSKTKVHECLKKLILPKFDAAHSAAEFAELDEHSTDSGAIAYYKWKKLCEE